MKKYKNTNIYIFLLNVYRFRHCFKNIGKKFGFFQMSRLLTYNLIQKKDTLLFIESLGIFVKPNFFVITTLIEIYNIELYQKLCNLECVLDLGAYIGESSVYLSQRNLSVVAFEPSREKFKLLEKNIEKHENIQGYNFAVVGDKGTKELTFYQRDPFDFCSSFEPQEKLTNTTTVQCKYIVSIMEKYNFDGLKMDIEGGEYPILDILLSEKLFPFKKGLVEFHIEESKKKIQKEKIDVFYHYLLQEGYTVRLFDNFNNSIAYNALDGEKYSCFNLEFIKNER